MDEISNIYTADFYKVCIYNDLLSAHEIAGIIIDHLNPVSVIDIGCGCGLYLKALHDLGVEDIIGYDGSIHALKNSLLPDKTQLFDLRKELQLDRKFDLCLCIEVAEHIDKCFSNVLVRTLTNLSDIIFFTAAPPGQGGLDHINEQTSGYWINLFEQYNYKRIDITDVIKNDMAKRNVTWWLTKNLMVLKKES